MNYYTSIAAIFVGIAFAVSAPFVAGHIAEARIIESCHDNGGRWVVYRTGSVMAECIKGDS